MTHRASPAWTRHLNFHTTCGYVNAARIRDGWVREFASSSNDDDTHPTTSQSTPPPTVHGWGSSGEDFTDPDGSKRRQIEVAIDRTGLFRQIDEAHGMGNENKKNLKGLEKHLASIINFRGGPITVAEYMQEVLTHPEWGYYMHRDVFGEKGDFITSPEVSQVFGELMGAWAVWQWEQMGKPREVRLVELGPGRGTLMADLLNGTSVFPEFMEAVTVQLVEVSPKNRKTQREKLRCGDDELENSSNKNKKTAFASIRVPSNPMRGVGLGDEESGEGASSTGASGTGASSTDASNNSSNNPPGAHGSTPEELGLEAVDRGVSGFGDVKVEWHETLDGVPSGPTILIAHEFFDAMPVHQFTRTERGWCEKLVAIKGSLGEGSGDATTKQSEEESASKTSTRNLELVLSPGLTPAGALMIPKRLQGMPDDTKQSLRQLEISPRTLAIWERVAQRIETHGGAALAIDYGEEGPVGNSLQAIKDHKFCDILEQPGSADLSIYVDFGAMRQVIENRDIDNSGDGSDDNSTSSGVSCFGPVSQRDLLFGLGIEKRLHALIEKCDTTEQAERVYDACARLVGGDELADDSAGIGPGMGFRYKAMAITSKGLGTPAGFDTYSKK